MRYLNALAILAVAVFLIGINSAEVLAKRPSSPPELEQRVTDLEVNDAVQDSQLSDHETRIGEAETKNDTQDIRLDTLESQPPTMGGIKVFDSSNPPQFVGILVGIYPAGYKPLAGYEVGAMFTVYVPEVGKFIELNRGGEVIESRFRFEYVYYKVDGCDDIEGIYAIPEIDEVVDPAFISAHWSVDPNIGIIWSFYKVGNRQDVWLESRHTGVIGTCDNTPSGLSGAFTLTEVTLPFTLPLTMPLSFQ